MCGIAGFIANEKENNINLKNDSFESMLVNYKEYMKQSDNELNDGSGEEKCKIEIVRD